MANRVGERPISRLAALVKGHGRDFGLLLVLNIFGGALTLVPPVIYEWLVDDAPARRDRSLVLRGGWWLALAAATSFGNSWLFAVLGNCLAGDVRADLRSKLFATTQSMPLEYFRSVPVRVRTPTLRLCHRATHDLPIVNAGRQPPRHGSPMSAQEPRPAHERRSGMFLTSRALVGGVVAVAAVVTTPLFDPFANEALATTAAPPPVIQLSVIAEHPVLAPFLTELPRVSMWSDGLVVLVSDSPPSDSLVVHATTGAIDPDVVAGLIERGRADGMFDETPPDYGGLGPVVHISHPPLTMVQLTDMPTPPFPIATVTLRAFGLGLVDETGDRAALADLVVDIESAVENIATTSYAPTGIAVQARAVTDDDSADVVAWPKTGPVLTEDEDCISVLDPDTVSLLLESTVDTRFEFDGATWQLAARPIVQGTVGCVEAG